MTIREQFKILIYSTLYEILSNDYVQNYNTMMFTALLLSQ